jgi:hypothetical protein
MRRRFLGGSLEAPMRRFSDSQPSGSHTTFLSCQTVSFWLVGFPSDMAIGTGTRGHSLDLKSDDVRPSEEDPDWL